MAADLAKGDNLGGKPIKYTNQYVSDSLGCQPIGVVKDMFLALPGGSSESNVKASQQYMVILTCYVIDLKVNVPGGHLKLYVSGNCS